MLSFMDAQPAQRSRNFGLGSIPTILCLGVTVYILSTGPIISACYPLPRSHSTLRVVYYPLSVLADKFGPMRDFFEWYVGIWGVK